MADLDYDTWMQELTSKTEAYKKELYDWAVSQKTMLTFPVAFTAVQRKAAAVNQTVLPVALGRELTLVEHGLLQIKSFIIPIPPDAFEKETLAIQEPYGEDSRNVKNMIIYLRQIGLVAPDGRKAIDYAKLTAAVKNTEVSKTLGFLVSILRDDLHVTHFVADRKQYARQIGTVFLCSNEYAYGRGVGLVTMRNGTIATIAGFSPDLLEYLSKLCLDNI